MISFAKLLTSACVKPNKRSAALVITPDSVDTPTVKREGTSTRMFCLLKAFVKLISIEIGVKSKNA